MARRSLEDELLLARRRQIRRRRAMAVAVLVAAAVAVPLAAGAISTARNLGSVVRPAGSRPTNSAVTGAAARRRTRRSTLPRVVRAGTYGVGLMTLPLVDHTRFIKLPNGEVIPRPVTTIVRYPTAKGTGGVDAAPERRDGRFPLLIFGPGFNISPNIYAPLLRYWTSAGFVVATLVFPLENPKAPGGPNENDLPNQPDDMRFVINSMLALSARRAGLLSGLIAPNDIAATGQSDGGDTALTLAYDPTLRDPDLRAVVILSGGEISAEVPTFPFFTIGAGGPPLLAVQGTADTVNRPSATAAFYDPAPPPKYLLQVLGGTHLGPYTTNRAQLGVVERVTTAFLQYYLEHDSAAYGTLLSSGDVPGVATLAADPTAPAHSSAG